MILHEKVRMEVEKLSHREGCNSHLQLSKKGHCRPFVASCRPLLLLPAAAAVSAAAAGDAAALQPCFGSPDGQAAARTTLHDALAVRSPAEHDALAVLLGVSCASAQVAAAERRLMVAPFCCEKGLHTSFSY